MTDNDRDGDIKKTIARLREQNRQPYSTSGVAAPNLQAQEEKLLRTRVTENIERTDTAERNALMNAISLQLLMGNITQGEALKRMRINLVGMKQDAYARLVGVSRKTISDIENNKINNSIETLNKVFKPFGLQLGLIPTSPQRLISLLNSAEK
ncbi:helix-turn-helix transcriptional regulator [Pseudocitrobacter vendiensis]|uniref:Helix-turn-helix transcriptional regulator n=1 Tax=Pseudocitrobacter vendiensis TaxID=2488306 RepID=A0ABM9F7S3_9ENTR|nr:helix-turn-helix transcriptional regulator [Pseudocitrobacter vendiensis]CAH6636851.1 Helix-turn-helix transcriptional regulator [Pseudocitrobacter vendiensis]